MKEKTKFRIFAIIFIGAVIYTIYEIVSCKPIFGCSLDKSKAVVVALAMIISGWGMYRTKNNGTNKELIEMKEPEEVKSK